MQTRILTQFKSDCQKLTENNNATDKQLQIPHSPTNCYIVHMNLINTCMENL